MFDLQSLLGSIFFTGSASGSASAEQAAQQLFPSS